MAFNINCVHFTSFIKKGLFSNVKIFQWVVHLFRELKK